MASDDPYATSSVDDDTSLAPRPSSSARQDGDQVTISLAPVSWTMLRLAR
jgi:hypothetical protein